MAKKAKEAKKPQPKREGRRERPYLDFPARAFVAPDHGDGARNSQGTFRVSRCTWWGVLKRRCVFLTELGKQIPGDVSF